MRPAGSRLAILSGLTIVLVATNRWMSWSAGAHLLTARDEGFYRRIALAAPHLPTARIGNQYAQLFAPNWLVGVIHAGLGVGVDTVYRVASAAIILGLCAVLCAILQRAGLRTPSFALCLALVLLNTYSLRYYLIAPGYVTDLGFDLCLAVIALGLVAGRYWLVLTGIATAVLVRQSALPVTFALAAVLLLTAPWRVAPRGLRIGRAIAVVVLPWALFGGVLLVSAPFSASTTPGATGLTLIGALERLPEGVAALGEHAARVLTPMLAVGGLLAVTLAVRARRRPGTGPPAGGSRSAGENRPLSGPFWACLVLGLSVWLQAVAFNPRYSGHPERLAVLALVPLVVALAIVLRDLERSGITLSSGHATAASVILAVGSLHYLYTWFGPTTPAEGEALQIAAACAVSAIAWHGLWRTSLITNPAPPNAAPAGAAKTPTP